MLTELSRRVAHPLSYLTPSTTCVASFHYPTVAQGVASVLHRGASDAEEGQGTAGAVRGGSGARRRRGVGGQTFSGTRSKRKIFQRMIFPSAEGQALRKRGRAAVRLAIG